MHALTLCPVHQELPWLDEARLEAALGAARCNQCNLPLRLLQAIDGTAF